MATLYLGSCDTAKRPKNPQTFLEPYHMDGILKDTISFRDDDRTAWRRFRDTPGTDVERLQQFLSKTGFMPRGVVDGIFDYVTQPSVRLFQEYVRSVEGIQGMLPDGIVGSGTWGHIERWIAADKISDWGRASDASPTTEYRKWINLLHKAKTHYGQNPHPILMQVADFEKLSDTRKIDDWEFDPKHIHLIGIRRAQDLNRNRRENDDIFILLVRGMVFKFWGSTDASQNMSSRRDEAFLVEGQHKYRFGWHKISVEKKIYRALKPYRNGVLVFRDRDDDNALTERDLNAGLDAVPNQSINIHWSGMGHSNWSAGCQVIAGKSYINHLNRVV
ncbi:MAG: peptidoglycan-binding domain-containing protein, partial [Pricia sp.]